MRASFSTILAAAATLPLSALAHYNFEALIVNNNITDAYEYVRQTTNSNSPITDVTSDDMICNQGGLDSDIRAQTSTYTVQPGDEVGFTVNVQIGHPGPLAVYLSKAPDGTEASDYLGGGDWFKVYELSTSSITDEGLQWATYVDGGIKNFTFALPDTLAAGNYLMRAEHIALHGASTEGGAQFYIGCAQLKVEGSGSGTPSPTVSIPGYLTGDEPGVLINIYYPVPTNYTAPGPKTWPNACEDHTANYVDETSDGDCTASDGTDSSSGSSSSAVAETPAASSTSTAVSTPSSTPESNDVVTTSISPAVTTAASENETTSVQVETPVATTTTTSAASAATSGSSSGSRCSTKRKARKAKAKAKRAAANRAAKRAAEQVAERAAAQANKRAIEEIMREGIYV